ncbi:hypothetical protein BJ875DRAFT_138783 [Amylocarpus encephaloides]|uniref:C2H2-type domain-containing protein n=1 Tax=Amylocarpus encephaloides TaxID=45428 RepID=A0A9P7YBV0_9HELO|nr:hypothetical protein BJ875DRAFT_138783 [Amylocarpus encephaloides]
MAHGCVPCDRYFSSHQALQQHLDSPAHEFDCEECDKSFRSQHALQQHLDSSAHNFDCEECDKSFKSQHALQQHLDSSAHNFDCEECDKSFKSQHALQQHLDSSAHNFDCEECDKSFKSQHALQQHLGSSAHNFDCDECDKSFKSQHALQQHLGSSAHNFDCDECDKSFKIQHALQQHLDSPAHTTKALNNYPGIPRSEVASVFATACRLRFTQPTANSLSRQLKTNLEEAVISAIIAAALRLLPTDDTPQGVALRIEQHQVKAAKAKFAEDSFCAELARLGYKFRRESQQEGEALTPDIRFEEPIYVFGQLCWWLEFKNYFGFRKNPYVAVKDRRQFLKYATQIGSGAVVYKLGYETSHVNIDGVVTFREKEVLQGLRLQTA